MQSSTTGSAEPASSPQRYAVTLVCPEGYIHCLALMEIAETLHYALVNIGADSMLTDNLNEPGRRQIVLGAHLLSRFLMGPLKPDSIIYNFEQVDPDSPWLDESYLNLLRTHEVWDYSERNIALLRQQGVVNIQHLPLGYAAQMERIAPETQDIDVLFYGSINPRRQTVLDELKASGLNVMQVFGLYGPERDKLIARSKLVLNLHFYESRIFEIARVSYLLTNGICVVSEDGPDPVEQSYLGALAFAPYEDLASTCAALINAPETREAIARQGQLLMRAQPQEESIKPLLPTHTQKANATRSQQRPMPTILNMGSGKDWKEEALNIDIEPEWNPDVVLDFNQALPPDGLTLVTRRFGTITLKEDHFDVIHSYDVLEHLQQLSTAMTSCLRLLKLDGVFKINVPYDLSWGAWQDPTHVRAFNERSWLYYTDWFWYFGWDQWRFDLISLQYMLSPIGQEMHAANTAVDIITRTPRAVDSMMVELRKRELSVEEKKLALSQRQKRGRGQV